MPCKLESTENVRLFEKYSTPPYLWKRYLWKRNKLAGSDQKVILTRQTCGQPRVRQQEKRRALAFCFFIRICYIFSISKCGEESDPSRTVHNFGTCKKDAAARTGQILRTKKCFNRKSPLRSRILFSSPKIVHRPRSNSSLKIDIRNTLQIYTEKDNSSAWHLLPAALLERWPHISPNRSRFD